MENLSAGTKEAFFLARIGEGKSFGEAEKLWLASGLAIKRGKSAKDNIVNAWLAGEVTKSNLKEWLQENGTENDVRQSSYYANRISDFELVASHFAKGKDKKQA